jgi:hypothetical protein
MHTLACSCRKICCAALLLLFVPVAPTRSIGASFRRFLLHCLRILHVNGWFLEFSVPTFGHPERSLNMMPSIVFGQPLQPPRLNAWTGVLGTSVPIFLGDLCSPRGFVPCIMNGFSLDFSKRSVFRACNRTVNLSSEFCIYTFLLLFVSKM